MKKHERARVLTIVVSRYLYSMESIPAKLNNVFLRWVEESELPTDDEIRWLKKKIDRNTYPELFEEDKL